jgi:hypothetical protein
MSRGQVSLSLVEAVVGLVVVFAAATTFLVSLPDSGAETTDLDRLAADGLTVLDATPAAGDASRLTALGRSEASFARHAGDAEERLGGLYPPSVRFRLETPYGAVGQRLPPSGAVGRAQRWAGGSRVALWVWYR